jgi:hypothetical protein
MQFKTLIPVLVLVGTSIASPINVASPIAVPNVALPAVPAVPKVALPAVPAVPKVALPAVPAVPKVALPAVPAVPKVVLPAVPAVPKVTLPTIAIPNLVTPNLAVIEGKVGTVITAVQNDLNVIMTAVSASAADVTKQTALVKIIVDAALDIEHQLQTAAIYVLKSTLGLVSTLTEPEIVALTATINNLNGLAQTLVNDLGTVKVQLTADTYSLVKAELAAVAAALGPFEDPLIAFAKSVQLTVSTPGGNSVLAVLKAVTAIPAALAPILLSLGL